MQSQPGVIVVAAVVAVVGVVGAAVVGVVVAAHAGTTTEITALVLMVLEQNGWLKLQVACSATLLMKLKVPTKSTWIHNY